MFRQNLRIFYKMTKITSNVIRTTATLRVRTTPLTKTKTMSTPKKYTPIVFDLLDKQVVNQDYHLVNREDLWKMDNETTKKRIDELNMRVTYARQFYKGKYDERHKKWMQTLAKPMKSHHRIHLSLDALIAIDN